MSGCRSHLQTTTSCLQATAMEVAMDKDMLLVLSQILLCLHLVMDSFPDLFGLHPRLLDASPSLATNMLIDEGEGDELPDSRIQMFHTIITDFVMLTCFKPRATITSRMWVKDRSRGWFYDFLMEYDDERWLRIMKMSTGAFNWLCNILAPHIQLQVTNYRQPLPVPMRVGAVIYKILWAATDIEMSEAFGIGRSTMYDLL